MLVLILMLDLDFINSPTTLHTTYEATVLCAWLFLEPCSVQPPTNLAVRIEDIGIIQMEVLSLPARLHGTLLFTSWTDQGGLHLQPRTNFQENYPGIDGLESTNVKFLMRWNNSDSFCLDYTLLAPSNAPQAVTASVTGPTIIFVAFENMWTALSTTVWDLEVHSALWSSWSNCSKWFSLRD